MLARITGNVIIIIGLGAERLHRGACLYAESQWRHSTPHGLILHLQRIKHPPDF